MHVNTIIVQVSAYDFAARLASMRDWLNDWGCQPLRFTYNASGEPAERNGGAAPMLSHCRSPLSTDAIGSSRSDYSAGAYSRSRDCNVTSVDGLTWTQL
jgi:hypothetical protein